MITMTFIEKIRENIFLFAIVILTITLLITFGVEQSNQKGQKKIDIVNDFYSATFKPMFVSNKINKQEVLNFAVDGNLVLDSNQNRMLKIQNDSLGNEILGIGDKETNNFFDYYSNIVEKLKLDKKRKLELDSILNTYANSLSNSIYTDENKIFAVDPQIGIVRNNLNRDLANFLRNDNQISITNASNKNVSANISNPEKNDFYVFTPDTVVKRKSKLIELSNLNNIKDSEKLNGSFGIDLKGDNDIFKFQIDSNFVNVNLDNLLGQNEFEDIKFIKAYFNDDFNMLNMSLEVQSDSNDNVKFKLSYDDSTNNKFEYEVNTDNIDNAITNSVKVFSGKSIDEWIEYGIKMDSTKHKKNDVKTNAKSK